MDRVSRRRQAILDQLDDDETVTFFEPAMLDRAILGLSYTQPGRATRCVVYDYTRLVVAFMRDGVTQEQAEEWISVNTLGSWVGEGTPIVVGRV